jgi:small GTP-binding protein
MSLDIQNFKNTTKYEFTFKIIVIGDSGVGKSCLTNMVVKDIFNESSETTIGFEFLLYSVEIEGQKINLHIWDTCGQELYRALITSFYKNAELAMIVYSIDSRESFIHIKSWLKEIRLHCSPNVKIILIGNKSDLEERRAVTYEEAKKFKDENEIFYFEETSAKTGINAKEVFNQAAKVLYQDFNKYQSKEQYNDNISYDSYKLVPNKLVNDRQSRKFGCC